MNAYLSDLRNIARVLGGDVTGRDSVNVPGPGHGKQDRSLSIKLNARAPGQFVVYSHAGDNPIECRDYVRERLGLAPWDGRYGRSPLVVTQSSSPDHDKERRKQIALRLWSQSVDPIGSIVEHYLREHRGLSLSEDISGSVIRFHGALRFDEFTCLPGMICLLRDIETNEPCGIHRTFLDRDTGSKIDRKMLGIAKGAAIKFDVNHNNTLTIGEGVETTLSARAAAEVEDVLSNAMCFQGAWEADRVYRRGACVSHSGSLWFALTESSVDVRPGSGGKTWKMTMKSGVWNDAR